MPARCLINQTLEVKHLLNNERLFACGVVPCKLLCNLGGLFKQIRVFGSDTQCA